MLAFGQSTNNTKKLQKYIDPAWDMQKKIYYVTDDFKKKTVEIKEFRRQARM